MKKKIILFLSLFMNVLLAETLEVNNKPIYQTKDYFTYAIAESINENIQSLKEKKWENSTQNFNTFKNFNTPYWAKIFIKNITSKTKIYYLKSENQFTYHIDFFLLKQKKIINHIEDGVIAKNKQRSFNTNHMIFPIILQANEEVEVLFKIQNYNKKNIDFTLVTKEYLLDYYQTYNMLEGIFFGGLLIMIFYNLFLYFLLRFRAYLYYVLYTSGFFIYFIGFFGFSQRYFPNYTWIFYISSGIIYVCMTLFVQSILDLKKQLPRINGILNIFILYFIFGTICNIFALEMKNFLYAQMLFNLFFILIPIFITIIISSTYYIAYYKNDLIAKFYSLVWTIVAFVGFLLPLAYLNILDIDIPFDYIFQFLILFEVLSFSFILSYKIRLIEEEKKKQEQMLVQQNKLASMGEMISVIAHQWRQPLSEINGVIISMELDYQKEKLSYTVFNNYLDDLEKTTSYMSNTIHDFMDFFKKNKKLEKFFISDIVKNTLILLKNSTEHTIEIQYKSTQKIQLLTYKSELIQALLIVLNNAIEACLENPKTDSKVILKTIIQKKNLSIYIKDNGQGIDKEVLNKIYDPYFTTKHSSKGTGLGLYVLKMIIEQNMQGKIEIKTSLIGTTVILTIPLNCEQ
jgi:signal transduction histidine kinase